MPDLPAQIGPYALGREIGRGGMGVVYLARDVRLDRDVAIKVLPDEVAADAGRLERFEREARTLAQLAHRNVAGIYGIEEADGRRYLVLEYVEGETLDARIDRGALGLDEALEIAVQIAAGLEAAHDAGVVHRDLKPSNVKITPEGVAKVLDFGLARIDGDASSSATAEATALPTVTTPARHSPTVPGVILGTAPYMSPEQARGRRVDRRTDVWAFGVVLHEMLTGRSPFLGETVTDTIGAILHKEVDLDALPPDTPPRVRRVLARCLERDKERRYRDIGDVRLELDDARGDVAAPLAARRRRSPARLAALAAGCIALGGAAAWILKAAPETPLPSVAHVSLVLPWDRDRIEGFAFSPDGTTLAFAVSEGTGAVPTWGVFVRRLDGEEFRRIHTLEMRPLKIAFAPDGRELIVAESSASSREYIGRLPVDGGTAVPLLDSPGGRFLIGPGEIVWISDDEFVLQGQSSGRHELFAVSRRDGAVRPFGVLDTEMIWAMPASVSPDRRQILFGAVDLRDGEGELALSLLDVQSGVTRPLLDRTMHGRHLARDLIVFQRDDQVLATRIDPETATLRGEIVPVEGAIERASISGGAGHLAYFSSRDERGQVAVLGADGAVTPIGRDRRWYQVRLIVASRDGRRIVVQYADRPGQSRGTLACVDVETGRHERVAEGAPYPEQWLADGRFVYLMPVETTGRRVLSDVLTWHPEQGAGVLLRGLALPEPALAITPDGRYLVHRVLKEEGRETHPLAAGDDDYLAVVDTTAPADGSVFYYTSGSRDRSPAFSADGRWLAFVVGSDGAEVYVTPFEPGRPPAPVRVSAYGGNGPMWSPDGTTLYFTGRERADAPDTCLLRATIEQESPLKLSTPVRVLDRDAFDRHAIAPLPGDRGFAFIDTPDRAPEDEHLHLVLNWGESVRRRLAP